jgi:hypothetical protein
MAAGITKEHEAAYLTLTLEDRGVGHHWMT